MITSIDYGPPSWSIHILWISCALTIFALSGGCSSDDGSREGIPCDVAQDCDMPGVDCIDGICVLVDYDVGREFDDAESLDAHTCSDGELWCHDECVDPDVDPDHCGVCDHSCEAPHGIDGDDRLGILAATNEGIIVGADVVASRVTIPHGFSFLSPHSITSTTSSADTHLRPGDRAAAHASHNQEWFGSSSTDLTLTEIATEERDENCRRRTRQSPR